MAYDLTGKLRLEVATEEPLNRLSDNDSYNPGGVVGSWLGNAGTVGTGNVGGPASGEYANGYFYSRNAAGSAYAYTAAYSVTAGDYVSAAASVVPNGADPAEAAKYRVGVFFYNASNVLVGTAAGAYVDRVYEGDGTPTNSTGVFVRPTLIGFVAPAGATTMRMYVQTDNTRVGYGFFFNGNVLVSNVLSEFVQDTSFIGTAPTTDTNRIMNPSGEQGVTHWQESNANMYFITRAGYVKPVPDPNYGLVFPASWDAISPNKTELIMLSMSGGAAQIASNTTPVTSGQWVSGNIQAIGKSSTNTWCFVFWQFFDSNGTLLRTDYLTGVKLNQTSPQQVNGPAVQAPANAASVRMVVRNNPNSTTTLASQVAYSWLMFKNARMRVDNTAPSDRPQGPETKWRNILGSTHSITVSREELDAGTMTAVIYDPVLDPARYNSIRRGYKVRLQALVEGAWTNVFVGTVHNAATEYFKDDKPRITLTATDATAILANVRATTGVADFKSLAGIMPSSVKWAYNGAANNTGNPVIYYNNDNASFLDLAVVARDTVRGYAYVDKNGTFQMWDTLPNVVKTVFSDQADDLSAEYVAYTSLESGYSMDELVNSVTVKRLEKRGDDDKTEEITYGPYENLTSINTYGASGLTVTVAHTTKTPQQVALDILNANATPVVTAKELGFLVKNDQTFRQAALMELYQLVTVKNAQANLNANYRIRSIEHSIVANNDGGEWETTVEFKSATASATAVSNIRSPSTPLKAEPLIGYKPLESNSSAFNTTEITVISMLASTLPGVKYKVTGQGRSFTSNGSGDVVRVRLYRNATVINEFMVHLGGAGNDAQGFNFNAIIDGTGAQDTYNVRVAKVLGPGTSIFINAGPTTPGFLLVERLG
jgi:hypothetical protein